MRDLVPLHTSAPGMRVLPKVLGKQYISLISWDAALHKITEKQIFCETDLPRDDSSLEAAFFEVPYPARKAKVF